ncbi:MAG: tetratricopeptide repeat protein [Nitrospinae bacterium]|nr:tetratricopeptide repeat protein [Nitrospinota bacterium]
MKFSWLTQYRAALSACLLGLTLANCGTVTPRTAFVSPPGDLRFAEERFNAGQYDAAEYYLKKVLMTVPDDRRALALLPWSYFYQDRFDKALLAFSKLHSNYPKDPDNLVGMGWSQFSLLNYEKAVETFEKAEKLAPDNFQVHKGKGFAYLKLFEHEKALAELGKIYTPEEIENIMTLWDEWRAGNGDALLKVVSDGPGIPALFSLPAEHPRYPGALLGYPAPGDPKLLNQAWKLFTERRYKKAAGAFQALPYEQASSLDGKNGLAWSLLRAGEIKPAEEIFLDIQRNHPKFPGALEGVREVEKAKLNKAAYAQYYFENGKYRIAGDKYKELAGHFPNWPHAYSQLGRIELQTEAPDKAQPLFQKALDMDPANATARAGLSAIKKTSFPELFQADEAFKQEDYLSAARLYFEYIDAQGKSAPLTETLAQAYNSLAWSLYGKKQYRMAIGNFMKTLDRSDLRYESAKGAGLSYFILENFERAAHFLNIADGLRPDQKEIAPLLDWSLLRSADPAVSEKHFKQALAKDPLRYSAYLGLGWIYYKRGKPDLGVEYFLKSISLDPDFALTPEFMKMLDRERFGWQVYDRLGWAYYHRAHYDKALELFQTSAQRQPGKSETLKGLGYASYRLGKYREAIAFLQRCLAGNANPFPMAETVGKENAIAPFKLLTSVQTTLGRSYYKLGQYPEAVVYFNLELGQHPNWPEVHDGLGWANLKLNRLAEARAAFNEALRLQPLLYSARKGLNEVKQALAEQQLQTSVSAEENGK